ncbi:MAG: hypothetical protein ACI97A_002373 [Planctomycetota bacterium]|jgi:hypothetical protein
MENLLRSEGRFDVQSSKWSLTIMMTAFAVGGFIYGASMGSFGSSVLQMFYSGIKVPLLLSVATMICLPNFYVLNLVLGLGNDFTAALKGVFATQAVFAILLASLSPVVMFFYEGTTDYRLALNFNGLPFLCALGGAQITLSRHYRPLIQKNSLHRITLWTWVFLYGVVAMQMAWVLRPFVGDPRLPVEFTRLHAWSNAFVVIWDDIVKIMGG